jgi:cytochrome c
MYAEPVNFGERLRDVITRRSGQIAMLTDTGGLILMRAPAKGRTPATIALADKRTPIAASLIEPLPPTELGRLVYVNNCQWCHRLDGKSGVGPPLNGILGRAIASTDFPYSQALQHVSGEWSERKLSEFLAEPDSLFPGTDMPAPQLSSAEANDLISFLRTTKAH